jgi:hypothetical protein
MKLQLTEKATAAISDLGQGAKVMLKNSDFHEVRKAII